jgi:hypothetical protein
MAARLKRAFSACLYRNCRDYVPGLFCFQCHRSRAGSCHLAVLIRLPSVLRSVGAEQVYRRPEEVGQLQFFLLPCLVGSRRKNQLRTLYLSHVRQPSRGPLTSRFFSLDDRACGAKAGWRSRVLCGHKFVSNKVHSWSKTA